MLIVWQLVGRSRTGGRGVDQKHRDPTGVSTPKAHPHNTKHTTTCPMRYAFTSPRYRNDDSAPLKSPTAARVNAADAKGDTPCANLGQVGVRVLVPQALGTTDYELCGDVVRAEGIDGRTRQRDGRQQRSRDKRATKHGDAAVSKNGCAALLPAPHCNPLDDCHNCVVCGPLRSSALGKTTVPLGHGTTGAGVTGLDPQGV